MRSSQFQMPILGYYYTITFNLFAVLPVSNVCGDQAIHYVHILQSLIHPTLDSCLPCNMLRLFWKERKRTPDACQKRCTHISVQAHQPGQKEPRNKVRTGTSMGYGLLICSQVHVLHASSLFLTYLYTQMPEYTTQKPQVSKS
jgi:hypothetical protein